MAKQATGANVQVLLDFEDAATYGADPGTPAALVMDVNEFGLTATQNKKKSNRLAGDRNPRKPFPGNIDVSAGLVVPVGYTSMWYWLKAMFDEPDTTGTGPYVHRFIVKDTQPSMVLEKQHTDITEYWKYNGCKISKWSMELGGDGELVSSFDVIGSNETPGATAYDASPTTVPLGELYQFEATLKEGGSAYADMLTLSMEIDFGLDPDSRPIGSAGLRKDLPEGGIVVSASLTAMFKDHALVDKGKDHTETSLQMLITSGTNILDISLPKGQYDRVGVPVRTPKGLVQSTKFTGYYDESATSSVVVTLTNGDAHA